MPSTPAATSYESPAQLTLSPFPSGPHSAPSNSPPPPEQLASTPPATPGTRPQSLRTSTPCRSLRAAQSSPAPPALPPSSDRGCPSESRTTSQSSHPHGATDTTDTETIDIRHRGAASALRDR